MKRCKDLRKDKFVLLFVSKGGTANARTQFQNQFDAVDKDTAFARIFVG